MNLSPAVRPLLTPAVLVGGYVILVTFTKDLQSIWPLRPGMPDWRFGTTGFFIGTGAVPVLGVALMAVAAAVGEKRRLAKAVGVLGIALGLAVVLALAVFLFDARSLLARVAEGASQDVVAGAVRRTTILAVVTAPAYLALGLGALRSSRAVSSAQSTEKSDIVVGK